MKAMNYEDMEILQDSATVVRAEAEPMTDSGLRNAPESTGHLLALVGDEIERIAGQPGTPASLLSAARAIQHEAGTLMDTGECKCPELTGRRLMLAVRASERIAGQPLAPTASAAIDRTAAWCC